MRVMESTTEIARGSMYVEQGALLWSFRLRAPFYVTVGNESVKI